MERVAPIGDPSVRGRVESQLLAWMAGRVKTSAQLGEKTRRLVVLHDAQGAAQQLTQAIRKRGVFAAPGREDGMSALTAVLTTPEAQACLQVLGLYADSLDDDPDGDSPPAAVCPTGQRQALPPRTRAEEMADCLLDLILRPGDSDLPVVQAQLTVVASIATLTGGDQPGEVNGQVVPEDPHPDDTHPDDTAATQPGVATADGDTADLAAATAEPTAGAQDREGAEGAAGWPPPGWSVTGWAALEAQLVSQSALAQQPGQDDEWPEHGIWLEAPGRLEDLVQLFWEPDASCTQVADRWAEHGIWLGEAATPEDLAQLVGDPEAGRAQATAAGITHPPLPEPPLPDPEALAPTGSGPGADAGGSWAAADAAVDQASVVIQAAHQAAAAAARAVRAAELTAEWEEQTSSGSPSGGTGSNPRGGRRCGERVIDLVNAERGGIEVRSAP